MMRKKMTVKLTIDQILNQAIAAHKASKFEEAEQLYKNILKAQPTHPGANHNLGVLKVSFNKSAEALPFFKAAIAANSKIGRFWTSYIDALVKENQFEEAEVSCRKAIELEPNLSKTHYNLGLVVARLGKLEEAEVSYKKAIELEPDYVSAYYDLGLVVARLGKLEEAKLAFKKTLSYDSGNKKFKTAYGQVLLKLNENKNGLSYIAEGQGVIEFEQSGVKII